MSSETTAETSDKSINFFFLCSEKVASMSIGRKGENVRALCQRVNVRLNVYRTLSKLRYIKIQGKPQEIGLAAEYVAETNYKALMGDRDLDSLNFDAPTLLVTVIHRDIVGAIIGKQGENIKNMSKLSETFMGVHDTEMLPFDESLLYIQGLPSAIKKAVECVCDIILKISPRSEPTIPAEKRDSSYLERITYDCCFSFNLRSNLASALVGFRGNTASKLKMASGVHVRVQQINNNMSKVELFGAQSSIELCLLMIDVELRRFEERNEDDGYYSNRRVQNNFRNNRPPRGPSDAANEMVKEMAEASISGVTAKSELTA